MSDIAFVWRNLRLAVRRGRGFVAFVSVGCALVLLCVGLVSQAAERAGNDVLESAALRTIELSSMHGDTEAVPLTNERLKGIAAMPEVVAVEPWLQAGFNTTGGPVPAAVFWATPRIGYLQPPIVASARTQVFPVADGEVVLPRHYADEDLTRLVGTSIPIQYTRRIGADTGEPVTSALKVVALYDEAKFNPDGPSAAYVSFDTVLKFAASQAGATPAQFGAQIPFSRAAVMVAESAQVGTVEQRLRDQGFAASSIRSQLDALPRALQLLSLLGNGTAAIVGLYCLGAGLTIGGAMVRNRVREIGLLKAIGFSRPRVATVFLAELFGFGLIAGVLGVVLGNVLSLAAGRLVAGSSFLGVPMADGLSLPDWKWSLTLIVLPAAAMAIGGTLPARRAATMPPDEALRDL